MESKIKFKPNPKYRLMDQVREVLRYYHYAYSTEQSYCVSRGTPMKICVSYSVDVCYVIIYTKKNRVNQNIEMLLMPPFFCQLFRLLFFTHPESGFGLSPIALASVVFLLVNKFDDFR